MASNGSFRARVGSPNGGWVGLGVEVEAAQTSVSGLGPLVDHHCTALHLWRRRKGGLDKCKISMEVRVGQ